MSHLSDICLKAVMSEYISFITNKDVEEENDLIVALF